MKSQIVLTVEDNKILESTIKSLEEISKPEVTETKIRIPVNDCKITATIDIDKGAGIQALYCGEDKQIATYLFDKEKWDMDRARKWVGEHKKAEKSAKNYNIPIVKQDEEKRLVYGIVMEPDAVDSQGDQTSAEEIEKACHRFMQNSQIIFSEHQQKEPDCYVVESYISPVDYAMGEQKVTKGSWVMVTYCGDEDIWNQVKKGELTGYSIRGFANRS